MAKIPMYQGSGELTRQAPAPQENIEAEGQTGRNIQMASKAVSEINQKFSKLDNTQRYYKSYQALNKDLSALQIEAENDPDAYKNRSQYYQKLEELKKKHNGDFYDPEIALQYNQHALASIDTTKLQIDNSARKNMIDGAIADDIRMEETAKYQFVRSGNDPMGRRIREQLITSVVRSKQNLRSIGAMSEKAYAEWEMNHRAEWGKDQFLYDLENVNSADSLAAVESALDSGYYGVKDPKELLSLKKMAEARANHQAAIQKDQIDQMQTKNMIALVSKKNEGSLTLKEIQDTFTNDGATPGITLEQYKWLTNEMIGKAPVRTESEKSKAYTGLIMKLAKMKDGSEDERGIREFQKQVGALKGEGYLDDGQFEYFVKKSEDKVSTSGLGVGVSLILSAFMPPPVQTLMIGNLVRKASEMKIEDDAEAVTKLANSIIKNEISRKYGVAPDGSANAVISRSQPLSIVFDRATGKLTVKDNEGNDGSTQDKSGGSSGSKGKSSKPSLALAGRKQTDTTGTE